MKSQEIYLRYYAGHKGAFGHEFIEFELLPDGTVYYANNSNYRHSSIIKRECRLSTLVMKCIRNLIEESKIMQQNDRAWPLPDRVGRQELEIINGEEHISFTTCKLGSISAVEHSDDPVGLGSFYYLINDIKSFLLDLIAMHYKIQPIK